jgi:outer membrane cobalamin receptor
MYRFPDLVKNYVEYSYQGYVEEKLLYEHSPKNSFCIGMKATLNQKSDRIVSLGSYDHTRSGTSSSWDIAVNGGGLYQPKEYSVFYDQELASYALWDAKWFNGISTSLGIRYDFSTRFGSVFNPRLALLFGSKPALKVKFLYGTAFRTPGIFELYSEFRGNPELVPERIRTRELELSSLLIDNKISLKTSVFHSTIFKYIGKVADSTALAGERFENLDRIDITGASFSVSSQLHDNVRLYSNCSYLIGFDIKSNAFYEIDNIARFKLNAGINSRFLKNKLSLDFRLNYVGRRKAVSTNTWIHTYENGYAPSYILANMTASIRMNKYFEFQVTINNLFDEQYYGLGRESGSGFIDDYDPETNINPAGFIPAYHPQPGRTFLLSILYRL